MKIKGFTVIELIIIIIILGILGIIAIPRYIKLAKNAETATVKAYTAILRAAATITYANVALGNIPGSTTGDINITSVYKNLEETGGIKISGKDYFTAVIRGKKYRWRYIPPLEVKEAQEY